MGCWGINQAMNEASDNLSCSRVEAAAPFVQCTCTQKPCSSSFHLSRKEEGGTNLPFSDSRWAINDTWKILSISADCKADQKLRVVGEMVRRLGKLDFRDKSFITIKSFHWHPKSWFIPFLKSKIKPKNRLRLGWDQNVYSGKNEPNQINQKGVCWQTAESFTKTDLMETFSSREEL